MSRPDTVTFYFEDKPLRIATRPEPAAGWLRRDRGHSLEDVLEEWVSRRQPQGICYVTDDVPRTKESVMRHFPLIRAAGGLVGNAAHAYLFILRHGLWDLPKGKMEKGESAATCAVREVSEECGLTALQVVRPLPSTVHGYYHKGRAVLKETCWFEMSCDDWTGMRPQLEEDITELRWMQPVEIVHTVFPQTYASIRELVSGVVEAGA